jgi:hypothetical protein
VLGAEREGAWDPSMGQGGTAPRVEASRDGAADTVQRTGGWGGRPRIGRGGRLDEGCQRPARLTLVPGGDVVGEIGNR